MEEGATMRLKVPRWMIEFTSHTMLHNRPPWFVYRPDIHKVRGSYVRQVLKVVSEGDILLRRFDGYLNTIFTPGFYGHAGIYVGNDQVVHSIGTGAKAEDILNFCRADALCVLEVKNFPQDQIEGVVDRALDIANKNVPYDFDFSGANKTYYCTELVDVAYGGIFYEDHIVKFGQLVLMPDGIRYSKRVIVKLEIKP